MNKSIYPIMVLDLQQYATTLNMCAVIQSDSFDIHWYTNEDLDEMIKTNPEIVYNNIQDETKTLLIMVMLLNNFNINNSFNSFINTIQKHLNDNDTKKVHELIKNFMTVYKTEEKSDNKNPILDNIIDILLTRLELYLEKDFKLD